MWVLIISGMLALSLGKAAGKSNLDTSEENKGYRVSYVKGSIKHILDYHANGELRNTIRIYDESHLPADIRRNIKNAYADSDIVLVTELDYENTLAYFVKIKQDEWTRTIQVIDNNMNVIEEFKDQ